MHDFALNIRHGGTSVIPNLDSIEQFRVLTNSLDPEYGNYNGGIITVISKSGSNNVHGSGFEFFRNTALDARGYFDPTRSDFKQNQFGGTLGGPIRHDKLFFFTDYQGTRTTQGISTGSITVPSLAQRNGNFGDLTGSVSGPYLASLLTAKLGYTVTSGEPYTSVFPTGNIPQAAWSAPGKNLLQYIPQPNVSANQFSTSAYAQTVRDNKGSVRVDANTRLGQLSGYYFVDDYRLDNPYPGAVAGASIPGFDALFIGRAQVFALSATTVLGANTVNEFHVGYLRNANIIGQPMGGLGVSLASQGFVTGANTPGIVVQVPQFEGIQNIAFPGFTMGVPITNETQVNNTYYASEGLSRVFGTHTLKVGGQFHFDQVNEHPNGIFNGTFNIDGTETGDPFADFLIGVPSSFQQFLRTTLLPTQSVFRSLRPGQLACPFQSHDQRRPALGRHYALLGEVQPASKLCPRPTIHPLPGRSQRRRSGRRPRHSQHHRSYPLHQLRTTPRPRLRAVFRPRPRSPDLRRRRQEQHTRELWPLLHGVSRPAHWHHVCRATLRLYLHQPRPTPARDSVHHHRHRSQQRPTLPLRVSPHNISRSNPDRSIDWSNFLPFQSDPFFNTHNRAPYLSN